MLHTSTKTLRMFQKNFFLDCKWVQRLKTENQSPNNLTPQICHNKRKFLPHSGTCLCSQLSVYTCGDGGLEKSGQHFLTQVTRLSKSIPCFHNYQGRRKGRECEESHADYGSCCLVVTQVTSTHISPAKSGLTISNQRGQRHTTLPGF